jgi:type I restriction enzyme R subunit
VKVEGFTVQTCPAGHAILCQRDGRDVAVPLDEYKQELAAGVQTEAPTLDDLRERWISPATRRVFLNALPGSEGAVRLVRALEDMEACDLYDVLAELTYGVAARSREERAASFTYKQRQWLRGLPDPAARVLVAVAGPFAKGGMEELETPHLFDVPEVTAAGGFAAFAGLPLEPHELLQAAKERILAA